eukprot:GHVU01070790.1.p2 GENE.GHVU01070790.1~~GHVU01070790.1.p2  ORF type:complete len:133 (+),score=34.85 GHVU01070790.1:501-899(+)
MAAANDDYDKFRDQQFLDMRSLSLDNCIDYFRASMFYHEESQTASGAAGQEPDTGYSVLLANAAARQQGGPPSAAPGGGGAAADDDGAAAAGRSGATTGHQWGLNEDGANQFGIYVIRRRDKKRNVDLEVSG